MRLSAGPIVAKAQSAARTHVAVVPTRRHATGHDVLLIWSAARREWTVPVAAPIAGFEDCIVAAQEARAVAGVVGRIHRQALGFYAEPSEGAHVRVATFVLEVDERPARSPELITVPREWVSRAQAELRVRPAGLVALLARL